MPTVNVPGKGVVRFPDTMTPDQIQQAIETEISPPPNVPAHLQPINTSDASGLPNPPQYEDAPTSPMPEPTDATEAALRGFGLGAQGASRGVADFVGAPVDLATGALNLGSWVAERGVNAIPGVDGVELPRIQTPMFGSEDAAATGANVAEKLGIPLFDVESLPLKDRIAYSSNRFGTNALLAGGAMRGPAMSRAANPARKPQLGDALMQPYETGATKPHLGDVAAGVGSGTALEAAREYLPESWQGPVTDFLAMIFGGAGGATLTAPTRVPGQIARGVKNALPDPNVEMMDAVPGTANTQPVKIPVSRGAVERAAEYYQTAASDPAAARTTIKEQTQSFRDEGLPVPTTGTLSNDIGLGAVEQGDRVRNPVPYQEADQKIRTAAAEEVKSLAPENAEPRAATELAGREAKQAREAAAANVTAAEKAAAEAARAEQAAATPYRAAPDKGAAARALDEVVVDETMKPMQSAKNEKFADIPNAPRSSAAIKERATAVRESVGSLNDPEKVLPQGTLSRIEALGDTVSFQDLNKLRPELTDAARQARRAGQYTLADNLNALKREIGAEAERMAAEGSPEAAEALRYFKEDFAPYFGDGTIGGKLKDAINKDTDRVNTPPGATADRFLNVAQGSKEAAADLARILKIAPDQAKGQAAVRSYVLSDLAKVIDKNGAVDPRRMRDWYTKRKDMLSEFPELDAEMRKLMTDSVNGRAKANATQTELKKATQAAKLTEDDIQRGNLSLLLDSSPEVAVRRVFGASDPEKAMAGIATSLGKDKAASEGWRKAVADYVRDSVSGTNTKMTDTGDAPVMFAAAKKFFDKNEKVLAKVYSGKEMNALRRAQKLMEPFGSLSRRATVGSPTAENVSVAGGKASVMGMLEIAMKSYYGVLEGGGRMRVLKLALSRLPNSDAQVGYLVHNAQLNPDLAMHLLDVPLRQQGTPAWNAKLNRLLGIQEASRRERETESRK